MLFFIRVRYLLRQFFKKL